MSYIYIMQEQGFLHNWKHKIGITNNVKRRRRENQTGNAERLLVVYSVKVKNKAVSEKVESTTHRILGSFRRRGEWFIYPPVLNPVVMALVWCISIYVELGE